jgi:hypothetical protein
MEAGIDGSYELQQFLESLAAPSHQAKHINHFIFRGGYTALSLAARCVCSLHACGWCQTAQA